MADPDPAFRPLHRPRRLRRGQRIRDAVADVDLGVGHLVLPLFVRAGTDLDQPIPAMPGVCQLSPDRAVAKMRQCLDLGLDKFILFGVVDSARKDATGSPACDENNPVHQALRSARDADLPALLIADLCFCEYTDHGHCGILDDDPEVTVNNDATLDALGRQAVVLARSGADVVAPSAMMDGQVGAVRTALDTHRHPQTAILSYSIKYASSFYGPFRDAAGGAPKSGDRRGYQMDYRRQHEWRTELDLDLAEGADMVMVKPALAYLDILQQVREATEVPVAAYHVSGEYAMIHAAAERGMVDLKSASLEATTAIRRAGADLILTYFAPQLAKWL